MPKPLTITAFTHKSYKNIRTKQKQTFTVCFFVWYVLFNKDLNLKKAKSVKKTPSTPCPNP